MRNGWRGQGGDNDVLKNLLTSGEQRESTVKEFLHLGVAVRLALVCSYVHVQEGDVLSKRLWYIFEVSDVVVALYGTEEQLHGIRRRNQTPVSGWKETRTGDGVRIAMLRFRAQIIRENRQEAAQEHVPVDVWLKVSNTSSHSFYRVYPFGLCGSWVTAEAIDESIDSSLSAIEFLRYHGKPGTRTPTVNPNRVIVIESRHHSRLTRGAPAVIAENQGLIVQRAASFRRTFTQLIHQRPFFATHWGR